MHVPLKERDLAFLQHCNYIQSEWGLVCSGGERWDVSAQFCMTCDFPSEPLLSIYIFTD